MGVLSADSKTTSGSFPSIPFEVTLSTACWQAAKKSNHLVAELGNAPGTIGIFTSNFYLLETQTTILNCWTSVSDVPREDQPTAGLYCTCTSQQPSPSNTNRKWRIQFRCAGSRGTSVIIPEVMLLYNTTVICSTSLIPKKGILPERQ